MHLRHFSRFRLTLGRLDDEAGSKMLAWAGQMSTHRPHEEHLSL